MIFSKIEQDCGYVISCLVSIFHIILFGHHAADKPFFTILVDERIRADESFRYVLSVMVEKSSLVILPFERNIAVLLARLSFKFCLWF